MPDASTLREEDYFRLFDLHQEQNRPTLKLQEQDSNQNESSSLAVFVIPLNPRESNEGSFPDLTEEDQTLNARMNQNKSAPLDIVIKKRSSEYGSQDRLKE